MSFQNLSITRLLDNGCYGNIVDEERKTPFPVPYPYLKSHYKTFAL